MSKIKMTLQVSAGYQYALILKQDGSLYGIGNNYSGQISDSDQKQIMHPFLMATHTKAFAAGCNYSIYIAENGDVKLVGNGEYTEKFSGFKNAQDVYACSNENIFLIEDSLGRWLAFGDNHDGKITASKTECIYQFPEEDYNGESLQVYGTAGPDRALQNRGGVSQVKCRFNKEKYEEEKYKEIVRTDIFRDLSKIYGEKNLLIDLNEIGEGECKYTTNYGGFSFFWNTKWAPRIMRKTLSMYNPIECDYNSIIHPDKDVSEDALANNAERAVTVGMYTFNLRRNNELFVFNHNSQKETFLLDEVYDMSMTDNAVIISKLNCEFLFGSEEQTSRFYSDLDLKHLNTYTIS